MNSGPKVQHKGPIRVEVTLTNQQDVDNFKSYLERLVGILPIKNPSAGRGRPAGSSNNKELESPREDILADVENGRGGKNSARDNQIPKKTWICIYPY